MIVCVCTPTVYTESIKLNFNYITKYNIKVKKNKTKNTPWYKIIDYYSA